MLGCLDACLFACLVADVALIWVAFWRPWVTCGVTWDGPCKLVGAFWLDWLRQGAQMSYLALPCGREQRFREIFMISLISAPWQLQWRSNGTRALEQTPEVVKARQNVIQIRPA